LNVLTIHAEVEGVVCAGMFEAFVKKAQAQGAEFVPLKTLLEQTTSIDRGAVIAGIIPGREGPVACQERAM
jgi:undecaprenyl phosphate-alpha-L-ara4FN deformylase